MTLRRFNGESGEIANYDYGWKSNTVFKTDVSEMFGGGEQRRSRWQFPLMRYSIPFNNKRIGVVKTLKDFFHDHRGQYGSFLFLDKDIRRVWPITSGYWQVSAGFIAKIWLPYKYIYPLDSVPTSEDVILKINGIQRTADISINQLEGSITFTADFPPDTVTITVEYAHYLKVRFAQDNLDFVEKTYDLYDCSFELVEVR